jgi:hypothetical protein
MNMPRFTAESSLYQTNGHYRTGRNALHLPAQMISPIHPAIGKGELGWPGDVPGDVIRVHGCAPGYLLWEAGGEWGCALVEPPPPPPPTGGGEPPGTPGGGGGGVGKGGGKPPRPKPTPEQKAELKARAIEIARCKERCKDTWTGQQLACALEEYPDICSSISDNKFSRCKTRCNDNPSHNAP